VLPVEPMPVMNPSIGRVEAKEIGTGLAVANLGAKESSVRLELWDEVTGRRGDGIVRVSLPRAGTSPATCISFSRTSTSAVSGEH